MKKILFILLLVPFVFNICGGYSYAQRINKISSNCAKPSLFFSSIIAVNVGDIIYTPCAGRSSIFNGIVDFSGATIVPGSGMVTGSGTTNFIPRWTNGTLSMLGDTPFDWNGTTYRFRNTALTSTFASFASGLTLINSGAGTASIGELDGSGFGTALTVNDPSATVSITSGAALVADIIRPAIIGSAGAIGSVTLPYKSVFIGNTTNNSAQLTGTFTANRVITFPDATGTVLLNTSAVSNSAFLTSNYTNATAGFTNTNLSLVLAAGKTYSFGCQVFASNSTAVDGFQIDFAGGTTTITSFIAGSSTTLVTGVTTTLAGTFSNATLTGSNLVSINGTITVNAGGTFVLRGAEVAHTTGTLSFLAGSRCQANLLN